MSVANDVGAACAICDSPLGTVLLVHDQRDRFEKHVGIEERAYRREWRECRVCGAATNCQRKENAEKLAKLSADYYEVDFAGSSIGDKYRMVMNLPDGQSDNAGRVSRVLEFADRVGWRSGIRSSSNLRVLDVGAGTGVFLSRFLALCDEKGESWTGVAVEPDPIAARHLRSLERFRVVEGLFEGQPDLRDFDLVTLNKVVEHVSSPVDFLRTVGQAVNPSLGAVYVEVPDVLTIGRRPPSDNILGALHHHLYTPGALDRAFRQAGLQSLELGRVFEPSGKLTVFGFAVREHLINRLAQ